MVLEPEEQYYSLGSLFMRDQLDKKRNSTFHKKETTRRVTNISSANPQMRGLGPLHTVEI